MWKFDFCTIQKMPENSTIGLQHQLLLSKNYIPMANHYFPDPWNIEQRNWCYVP